MNIWAHCSPKLQDSLSQTIKREVDIEQVTNGACTLFGEENYGKNKTG